MREADLVLFALLGGTALLLYGVRLVGEGPPSRLLHCVFAKLPSQRLRRTSERVGDGASG